MKFTSLVLLTQFDNFKIKRLSYRVVQLFAKFQKNQIIN